MRDDEYRKLRRALEEQCETDLELIRAGHRAKLHALEMLRELPPGPEERAPAAPETQPRAATQELAETRRPAAEPVARETILINSVQEEVEAILPRLPEIFDKRDIVRILGWEPHRATLHRTLATLQDEKKIAVQDRSRGRNPARYRKVGPS